LFHKKAHIPKRAEQRKQPVRLTWNMGKFCFLLLALQIYNYFWLMQAPLINILIRTHQRPTLFQRCLASVQSQNYPNIRVIVSTDCECNYVPDWCERIKVMPHPELEYGYDLYVNDLKAQVTDGWMLILDDDEVLSPNCLSKLTLNSCAIIVQLDYMGNILPIDAQIKPGRIGMPCIILHHSLKDLIDMKGEGN
jgi:hypothetical protein